MWAKPKDQWPFNFDECCSTYAPCLMCFRRGSTFLKRQNLYTSLMCFERLYLSSSVETCPRRICLVMLWNMKNVVNYPLFGRSDNYPWSTPGSRMVQVGLLRCEYLQSPHLKFCSTASPPLPWRCARRHTRRKASRLRGYKAWSAATWRLQNRSTAAVHQPGPPWQCIRNQPGTGVWI